MKRSVLSGTGTSLRARASAYTYTYTYTPTDRVRRTRIHTVHTHTYARTYVHTYLVCCTRLEGCAHAVWQETTDSMPTRRKRPSTCLDPRISQTWDLRDITHVLGRARRPVRPFRVVRIPGREIRGLRPGSFTQNRNKNKNQLRSNPTTFPFYDMNRVYVY